TSNFWYVSPNESVAVLVVSLNVSTSTAFGTPAQSNELLLISAVDEGPPGADVESCSKSGVTVASVVEAGTDGSSWVQYSPLPGLGTLTAFFLRRVLAWKGARPSGVPWGRAGPCA